MPHVKKRGNRNGCIFRKGRTYYLRWMVDGVTLKRSLHTGDRREAECEAERILAAYRAKDRAEVLANVTARLDGARAEIARIEAAHPALSIPAAWGAYEKSGLRPDSGARTLSDYEGYYSGLAEWLKENRPDYSELREVTQADAEDYAAELKAKRSAGTYNKRIVFFRCMWRVLLECEAAKLTRNPWEKIQKREVITHSRRELTVEELARVCSAVDGEMRLLFALGLYTGLRLGDCALLDWGAVDLVRGRITVIPRKTARHAHGRQTLIPIHATLAAMLSEIPQGKRRGYVMPETADMYMREPSMVTNRVQRVFRDCGIRTQTEQGKGRKALTDVGFHSLRHTFVSLSANAGAPLAIVQAIVGHSNPAMTRHYFHEQEGALVSAVAALPDVTGAGPAKKAIGARGGAGGADVPENGADAPEAKFEGCMAILDGMGADCLRRLAAEIERRLAVQGVNNVPVEPMQNVPVEGCDRVGQMYQLKASQKIVV